MAKAAGEPGWKGLPRRSWDGSNGVNCMSKAVPGVEASAPFCPNGCVLIEGMFAARFGCLSPYPPMENWFEL